MNIEKKLCQAAKALLSMGVPLASTRLVQTLNTFIAMAILAQLGHTVLAASFLIGIIRTFIFLVAMAPLFALGSIMSRQIGAKNTVVILAIVQQSWVTIMVLSVIPVVFMLFIGPILTLLGQPSEVIEPIKAYFHMLMPAVPLILFGTAMMQFLSSIKQQKWVLINSIISLSVSTFLCYGFTLGHFGLPKLGVPGAALATVCSNLVMLCVQLVLLSKLIQPFGKLWQWHLGKLEWMRLNLKIGLPIAIQLGSNMATIFFFGIMIGWLGQVAMSASQIASQYALFVITAVFGLSEAATITVGHAHGQKAFERVHQIGIAGIWVALLVTLIASIIFIIFHRPLVSLFIDVNAPGAHQIYMLGLSILAIRMIATFFDGTSQILTGALRGLYDTKFPMALDVLANWLLMVPVGALFGFGFGWGVIGLSVGAALTRLINMGILIWRWRVKTRALLPEPVAV